MPDGGEQAEACHGARSRAFFALRRPRREASWAVVCSGCPAISSSGALGSKEAVFRCGEDLDPQPGSGVKLGD